MAALQFPFTVFKSQKKMDDSSASDMRCGDLSENELKRKFHLVDISTRADPYKLTKITPFNQPQSRFYGMHGQGEKITQQECARILFDEFRSLSRPFAAYGPYKHLIEKMITHLQEGEGQAFRDPLLDSALKEQILNDKSKKYSSFLRLKQSLASNIDWNLCCFDNARKHTLIDAVKTSILPKFCRFQDNFNGMGITIHDTWATHITVSSLKIEKDAFQAVINYKIQDHFGLDNDDIMKAKFNQFHFFRIWFLLQRYDRFGFKPFFTNLEARVEIKWSKND